MISVDANYKGNRLNKDIKKENSKKDLMNLIETNHQINMISDHSVSSNNHQINMISDHSVSSNNHQINMTSDHSVSSNNHQINMISDHSVSSNNSFKSLLNASSCTVAVVQSTMILLQCLLQG